MKALVMEGGDNPMSIVLKIRCTSIQELDTLLEKIADIGTALRKKHPDIVINVEAEMG